MVCVGVGGADGSLRRSIALLPRDGWGRAAFEPSMMVSLLLYAYARGERSSRGIERKCVEDVALPGDRCPAEARSRDDREVPCPP